MAMVGMPTKFPRGMKCMDTARHTLCRRNQHERRFGAFGLARAMRNGYVSRARYRRRSSPPGAGLPVNGTGKRIHDVKKGAMELNLNQH